MNPILILNNILIRINQFSRKKLVIFEQEKVKLTATRRINLKMRGQPRLTSKSTLSTFKGIKYEIL